MIWIEIIRDEAVPSRVSQIKWLLRAHLLAVLINLLKLTNCMEVLPSTDLERLNCEP